MVGSEMKEECVQLFQEAWRGHRGCVLGAFIGAFVAISILLFGFWNMLFIGLCVAVGLWLGKRIDDADDGWLQNLREVNPRDLREMIRRK